MTDRDTRRIREAIRRTNAARPTFRGWIRLESSGWYIQQSDFLDDPAAAELLGNDIAWYFAVTEWRRRRPPVWRRSRRRAWLVEEAELAAAATLLTHATAQLRTLRPATEAPGARRSLAPEA